MPLTNIVHVAVAVIKNSQGHILIAKRPEQSHQGGLWEFPGGKIENNESVLDALKRELFEEIGITLRSASPLIRIHHDYTDKSVLLDVWSIDGFSGEAFGKEEQETKWIPINELSLYDFPSANIAIIKACQLPDRYMITGQFKDEKQLLNGIKAGLDKGIKLIQFRAKDLAEEVYFNYAKKIYALCLKKKVKLLLNKSVKSYSLYQADKFSHGLHLDSNNMKLFSDDLLDSKILIATSVHNQQELLFVENNNIDFMVLSPVNKTLSHPDSIPLGWDKFIQLTEQCSIPIYALGGMTAMDLKTAKDNGAQGIAAIGEFWNV